LGTGFYLLLDISLAMVVTSELHVCGEDWCIQYFSLTEPSSYHGIDTDFIIPVQIWLPTIRHDSILEDPDGDSSQLQCLSECYHDNLKNVMITGFCSAKSMVKLTIHIMQKARSLDYLTLDTTRSHDKRFANIDRCWPLSEEALVEAGKARVAIERYIEERVPPSVNLKIIEPCSKCTYR
jgi:hypothetical protein